MMAPARLWLAFRLDELRLAMMLLTRLPVGRLSRQVDLADAVWAYPLAGALVGGLAGAVFEAASRVGLSALPAALLTLAVAALLTGAMHEDGLADVADGFGGGATRERKLEIMRDSRIGSYGVVALILALGLRGTLIAGLPPAGAIAPLAGLGAMSRAVLPVLMLALPPARVDGLGQSARARISGTRVLAGLGVAVVICWAALPKFVVVVLGMATVAALMGWLARRQIAGFTGDLLGAVQIVAEIVGLAVLTLEG